ncbi:MAG TPA: hypothetical protein VM326_06840 [Sphingomicrobium sp.]|jgi:hypothetical protein|nr:hypothetical protein [Sphingomicrobium sp.]
MPRLSPLILLLALAACEDNPATQPSQPIVVRSEGQDRLHQLDDLNRAIALRRAIYESGSACPRVAKSGYVGEYENTSYWTATCEDRSGRTTDWALFVGPDESVQVRLCEDVVKAGLQPCVIKPGAKAPGSAG